MTAGRAPGGGGAAFSAGNGGDPFYDVLEDWELVAASFQSMYGMRLSRELRDMKWREFAALLQGLDERTPLGRIAAIRAEDDPERLRAFTPEMRRVRTAWRTWRAKQMPKEDVERFLDTVARAFAAM